MGVDGYESFLAEHMEKRVCLREAYGVFASLNRASPQQNLGFRGVKKGSCNHKRYGKLLQSVQLQRSPLEKFHFSIGEQVWEDGTRLRVAQDIMLSGTDAANSRSGQMCIGA